MIDFYACLRHALMALDPEKAHRMTLNLLKSGFGPSCDARRHPALATSLWGREFPNPLGLAAGFDKDAEALAPLCGMGFGFVEAGTVTLRAQPGNPRPRVFRDVKNKSVVNRLGFPGQGLEAFAENLRVFRAGNRDGIAGVNIGINKDTATPAADYRSCIEKLSGFADYIVINISSPNTAGLRDLQAREALDRLLPELKASVPLLLKVAPDLNGGQRADIAELALAHGVGGLVISNTTVARPSQLSPSLQGEAGGLSGMLLKEKSLETLSAFYRLTAGKIPLIGVGGISSAEDAYERIRAGASLVQVYTGLAFEGPRLIPRILDGLAALLARDGFTTVAQAVGTGQMPEKAVI